jgi:hypothetical protein
MTEPIGVEVNAAQGLPDVTMVVLPGQTVSPANEDRSYGEGEEFTVDAPTAITLTSLGHAKPKE